MKKGCDQSQESRYKMEKMTKREFFVAVMEKVEDAELKLFAEQEIAKMDERNAKRKNAPSKKSIENEPIKEKIVEYLGRENELDFATASEIANEIKISVQKASALCRQLVENGTLASEEVKVKGKGKVKGYKIA